MYKEAFYKMAADDDNGSFLGGAVTGTLGTLGAGTAAILANKKFGLLAKLLSKFKGAPLKDIVIKAPEVPSGLSFSLKGSPIKDTPLKVIKGLGDFGIPLADASKPLTGIGLKDLKSTGFSNYLNSFDPHGIGFMDFLKNKGGIAGKAKEMGLPGKSNLNKVLYKKLSNGTTLKFDPSKDSSAKFLRYIDRMLPKVKRNSKDYKDLIKMQQELEGSLQ